MRPSKILVWWCFSFVAGVFLGPVIKTNNSFSLPLLFPPPQRGGGLRWGFFFLAVFVFLELFLIALALIFKKEKIWLAYFSFLFLVLGIWRYPSAFAKLSRPDLQKFFTQTEKKEILLEGIVIEDPEIEATRTKFKLKIPDWQANILITAPLYPKIEYGDLLRIKGQLKEPPVFEDFNYKAYLQKQNVYFLMSYPQIEILKTNAGSPLKSILIKFKNKMKQSLAQIVPYSQVGLFEALIFGDEQNISLVWKEKLNISGTRHIAAVSGANITILTMMLLEFLLFLGLWRYQAFWLSLILIFAYILMIGAPSCGVRAGIMAALFLFCGYCGRIADPERLLLFALTGMLIFNPLLLSSDIGFQLSFLAVLGLIYFGSVFANLFKKIPSALGLRMNLSSTLAAQILVMPILIYNFKQFSIVSPLSNILILPFIPFLTITGFAFSFLGLFFQKIAWIISLPAQISLQLILWIIDLFSKLPFANREIKISGLFVFVSYAFLAIIIYFLKKRAKTKFLIF